MTSTMALRGPDASGTWVGEHAALCHRRLAIIDLEGGAQPMIAETSNGPVALTYSGEVYNFVELRDELRSKGHQFRTSSDTEVVLVAYLEWGEEMAAHLNGMYAFAIWDSRTKKLVMVRDRLGIKPLYYYPTPDGVLFGSEPKAILANPLAKSAVTIDGLRELFVCRLLQKYMTPGHAVWSGMLDMLPGTTVVVDARGVRVLPYWSLPSAPHTDDLKTTIRTVEELFHDIVARQLVADVPRCVLLSGGLDSSAITAIAAQHLAKHQEKVRTFAFDFVGYAEQYKADESRGAAVGISTHDAPFAREVVAFLGTIHTEVVINANSLADPALRAATVGARDLPNWHGNRDYSALLLFRAIREHSTVALSGESGDEVFGGYPWMEDVKAIDGARFPWTAADGMVAGAGYLRGLLNKGFVSRLDIPRTIVDSYENAIAGAPLLAGEEATPRKQRQLGYLALTRHLRGLLDKKDRMSMAAGLEVRVPYCDHRLIEYVFNTPWSVKSFDGREKSLLRATVQNALPQSVVMRKKSPWPDTQDPRFFALLQSQVAELVSRPQDRIFELFDRDGVAELAKLSPDQAKTTHRVACERLLEVSTWLDTRKPQLET